MYWKPYYTIIAVAILLLDIVAGIIYMLWYNSKKKQLQKEQNEQSQQQKQKQQQQQIIMDPMEDLHIKEAVNNISDSFAIPAQKVKRDKNDSSYRKISSEARSIHRRWSIDTLIAANKYAHEEQGRKIKIKKPKLYFKVFYNFQSSQIHVSLRYGKYLPILENRVMNVSIIMSHSLDIYKTIGVVTSNPVFNEDVRFPLSNIEISSTPPIMLKFNVWIIDRFSRKYPFGYIEVSIPEVLSEQASKPGDNPICRNIIRSEVLTDESQQGDVFISLSYLRGEKRISIVLIKAKCVMFSDADKEIQGKVTLLYRNVEQKVFYSGFVDVSSAPVFNKEFIILLSEYKIENLDDNLAISVELQSREKKLARTRKVGKVLISGLESAHQSGREHFGEMMKANSSVSKWHPLKSYL